MLKIAVITCYKDPDYIRARTIRSALALVPGVEVLEIKNTFTSLLLRVPQVIYKTIKARFSEKPDVYLITFRGYELFPFVLAIAGRHPVIFDEFIQPVEVVTEHRYMKQNSIVSNLMRLWTPLAPLYYALLRRAYYILTDTQAHADYSATIAKIDPKQYLALPVGTDESLFKVAPTKHSKDTFRVFYYGNMVPLHGVRYVIDAARKLKRFDHIQFKIVGGDESVSRAAAEAIDAGAHITYLPWIPFEHVPNEIRKANLCLGGPFGDTVQAHNVVTGKTYQFIACGVATVIGKSRATKALFIDKENALVVQQASSEAIARAVLWGSKHPQELEQIGKAGRELYKKEFSTQQIAKKLRGIILPLVREAAIDPEQSE